MFENVEIAIIHLNIEYFEQKQPKVHVFDRVCSLGLSLLPELRELVSFLVPLRLESARQPPKRVKSIVLDKFCGPTEGHLHFAKDFGANPNKILITLTILTLFP